MPYTIESIPEAVDAELQRRARAEGKTVEQVIVDVLGQALASDVDVKRVLEEIAGSWEDDPAFDEAMADFERIDEEMWR